MSITIVSGGQTGVDRAALDVAIELQLCQSGWCPKGRLAEDGIISDVYNLRETPSDDYNVRTVMNIRDSDATLVVIPADHQSSVDTIADGTRLTVNELKRLAKPYLIVGVSSDDNHQTVRRCIDWLSIIRPLVVLNIAGPRESTSPGVYQNSYRFLRQLLLNYFF